MIRVSLICRSCNRIVQSYESDVDSGVTMQVALSSRMLQRHIGQHSSFHDVLTVEVYAGPPAKREGTQANREGEG